MHACMRVPSDNYRVPAKAWDGHWIHSARSMGRYLFKGLTIKVGVESIPTLILKGFVWKHPCGAGWGSDGNCVSCPTKCHSLFQQLLHCQIQVFNHYVHANRGHAHLSNTLPLWNQPPFYQFHLFRQHWWCTIPQLLLHIQHVDWVCRWGCPTKVNTFLTHSSSKPNV